MSVLFFEEVVDYLKNNFGFFEQYVDLVVQIFVLYLYGGWVILLVECQMLILCEKNWQMESKLVELIVFGEENDVISEKVYCFFVVLIVVEIFQVVIYLLNFYLCDDFLVLYVVLCLWNMLVDIDDLLEFVVVSEELQVFVEMFGCLYCGLIVGFGMVLWFGEYVNYVCLQVLIVLCNGGGMIGMIVLGSEEVQCFYVDMGIFYFECFGEMVLVVFV